MADEETARFIAASCRGRTSWRALITMIGSWHANDFGMFRSSNDQPAGWIGRLAPWMPEGWPGTSVGRATAAIAGAGLRAEGATAATDSAFHRPPGLGRCRPRECRVAAGGAQAGLAQSRSRPVAAAVSGIEDRYLGPIARRMARPRTLNHQITRSPNHEITKSRAASTAVLRSVLASIRIRPLDILALARADGPVALERGPRGSRPSLDRQVVPLNV